MYDNQTDTPVFIPKSGMTQMEEKQIGCFYAEAGGFYAESGCFLPKTWVKTPNINIFGWLWSIFFRKVG
jgi:hypothetical protein